MDQARQEQSIPGTDDQEAPDHALGFVQSNNAISSLSFVGPAIAPTTTASLSNLAENLTLRDTKDPPKEQCVSKKRKTSSTERRLHKEKTASSLHKQSRQPTIVAALSTQEPASLPAADVSQAAPTTTAALSAQSPTPASGSQAHAEVSPSATTDKARPQLP